MSIFEEVIRTAIKNGITVEFSPIAEMLSPGTYDTTFRRGRYFSSVRIPRGELMDISPDSDRIEGEMLMEALRKLEMRPYMEIMAKYQKEE